MNRKALLTGIVTAGLLFPVGIAHAAPEPTTHVELNVDAKETIAENVQFDPSVGRTEGLQALRELRAKMWDANPQFRGYGFEGYEGTLQDAAEAEGITSKAEYLDVTMDSEYAWIAIQRAYESSTVFSHKRPDGSEMSTATINGHSASTESLAAGTGSLRNTILKTWGEGELKALKDAKGLANGENGHLVNMIHPQQKYYGFGAVEVEGSEYGTYFAGLSSNQAAGSDDGPANTPAGTQTVELHRAPMPSEEPKANSGKDDITAPSEVESTDAEASEQSESPTTQRRPVVEVKELKDIFQSRS